jgi:RNA polymerase sigma-70 factor (ECF subfamily)
LTSEDSTPARAGSPAFVTTQWTRVLKARGDSPEARVALSDLCGAYYAPVFAFIRRQMPDDDAARDSTHEFFAGLLARHGVDHVDPQRGRFRSYLLGAVKHFMADRHDREHRLKRDARVLEPIETGTDTSAGRQLSDPRAPDPEREFDRKWALTVLARALAALAHEHEVAGKSDQFDALKPWLTGDADEVSQAETARGLAMNEGAVKVAIHRLRRRFRECIKTEIGGTLSDRAHVNEELKHLLEALG